MINIIADSVTIEHEPEHYMPSVEPPRFALGRWAVIVNGAYFALCTTQDEALSVKATLMTMATENKSLVAILTEASNEEEDYSKHQWWCAGLDPCACTETWKRKRAELESCIKAAREL